MPDPRRAVCAAAFACVALLAAPARAEVHSGALFLATLPGGADVWIDETYVGRTPVLVDSLSAGRHAVTLTKSGWVTRDVDLDVAAGTTTLSSIKLAPVQHAAGAHPATGSVEFRGLEQGARLTLDGSPHDPHGVTPLGAGTHVAIVTSQGEKRARTFTVYAQTTTEVVLSDSANGTFKAAVVAPAEEYLPDDAYHIDGKKVVVRYGGHEVVGRLGDVAMRYDGTSVSYDAAPSMIGKKLYLPLALLARITEIKAK